MRDLRIAALCAVALMAWLLPAIFALPAWAQANRRPFMMETAASEALLEEARGALVNFRMPAAEATLRRLARRPDGAVAAYYHLALASFYKGLFTDDAAYADERSRRADTLSGLLDAAPAGRWRTYLRAEMDLQDALEAARANRQIRSAWAGRAAYKGFSAVLAAYPDFEEAYKGMGLMHVMLGSVPGAYQGLLRVLGFGGSVEEGLDELGRAAARARYGRAEAAAFRALLASMLGHPGVDSVTLLCGLHEDDPSSPVFAYLYAYALRAQRRAAEAEPLFRAAVEAGDGPDVFAIDFADYYLAETLYYLGRLREAEAYFRRYLSRHRTPALKAMANLQLGLAVELQGRRNEALVFYRRVQDHRGTETADAAAREVGHYLSAPLDERRRRLVLGRSAYDGGRYAEAEAQLALVRADAEAPDEERAEAAYRLGRLYQAQGRLEEALAAYLQAARPSAGPAARWAPWALYYSGQIHTQRGAKASAEQAFRAALAHRGDADYADTLESSVKAALERL